MAKPIERKRLRTEEDNGAPAGDNRGASDPDGNRAAGDTKSPGVKQPGKPEKAGVPRRTK